MALSKIQAESMNLADTYSFTGTVSGIPTEPTFKNLIINGAMQVSQRGTSAVTIGAAETYVIDRFLHYDSGSGVITAQQVSDSPAYFNNSLKVTVTTADASSGSSEYYWTQQKIEGLNSSNLSWGSSDAQSVTLSFWVKSSVTGTHGGAFSNGSFNRGYPFTYTINSADTWERKTITIDGDTAGTWLTTNGIGVRIYWDHGSGPTYAGTSGAWVAAGRNAATGVVKLIQTLNATWQITGVQLEVGTSASDFEFLPYDVNYQRCLRYLYQITSNSSTDTDIMGVTGNGSAFFGAFRMPVKMRTAVSVSKSADSDFYIFGGSTGSISNLRGDRQNEYSTGIVSDTSTTAGTSIQLRLNSGTGKYLRFDAEL